MSEAVERGSRSADIEQAALALSMAALAGAIEGEPDPEKLDAVAVRALRRAYALPIVFGLLRAAAKFVWVTAPPGATLGGLMTTMEEGGAIACQIAAEGDMPAGEYWVTAAAALAQKRRAPET